MKRILAGLALALLSTTAMAADNLAVTPGSGATVKMRDSTGSGGPLVSYIIPADLTGTSVWGTAGSANANILTVQGIASMTPLLVTATQSGTWNITNISGTVSLPTGASTSALQPTNAAIASTTAAQTGHLVMGAVTTASPTYTTAQTNPLSLDTAGNLRVNVVAGGGAGGTSSTFGATFPATGTAIGGSDNTTGCSGSACMHSVNVTSYGTNPGANYALAVNAFVTNTNANGQTTSANSSPVTLATDTFSDPCFGAAKSTASFSSTTSGGQIVAGTSSKRTYVCSMTIISSTAASVSLVEGTGSSVCTGSPVAVWGNTGTTAANGMPFGATGGVTLGNGAGTVAQTATNANNLCLLFTTTNTPTVVATVAYVQK